MNAQTDALEHTKTKLESLLINHLESQLDLWDSYVDPREAYRGPGGERWEGIGVAGITPLEELPFTTSAELFDIQGQCRILAKSNEFAINGYRNRINYIIGNGHNYSVVAKHEKVPEQNILNVQSVLDEILRANNWNLRQRETKFRADRDGEVFLRKFRTSDGIMKFRFVEPRQVVPPSSGQGYQSFGVETKENDIETVVAYWIDGEPVGANEVQHRKYNVDSSIKRGYPIMFPIRHNLRRAVKLLKNMSVATEIQTAIALIRKHEQGTRTAVRTFIDNAKAGQVTANGKVENVLRYPAGSILDSSADYSIPPQLDPSKTVAALQAELRACASCLVMPEFMFSSDASNSAFASTMVAEGPAVKNFESEQDVQIAYDRELIMEALQFAVDSGRITQVELDSIKLQIEPPLVSTRDALKEAQVRQIDMGLGILSIQTATAETNRDYKTEQTNIERHAGQFGVMMPTINQNEPINNQ